MPALRLRYQTYEFAQFDIHLRTLRDKNQFSDPLGEADALGISSAQWSLFGVVWPSSLVLATLMSTFNVTGKRILEVGCGIGLTSLVLNARDADITATDYHPEAGHFLTENTRLNEASRIPFLRTDWNDNSIGLGSFDLIVGSDLLYEQQHIQLLTDFIERHSNKDCEVILVDPGRGNHAKFSKRMQAAGFEFRGVLPTAPAADFSGKALHFSMGSVSHLSHR